MNKEMKDRIKRHNEKPRSETLKNGTRAFHNDSNTSQRIWDAKISSTQGCPDKSGESASPTNVSDAENLVVIM